ncbi:phosphate signaling complex protein PhoU [Isoptericola sp. b441]|uniref:Phosphate-specific transport system accessory protein PhoU n=1 Tax=Actinotalea lenta TaxID=3064654 RepID=A0ABT9D710_9CELL|nr:MULTISPECIES: phosphate signaling complex protein PhoU [unclassified Isoptericola]MDO8106621.1 phosphate signaling complex protein PhoU [Isoptericola sp. b441]MDO8121671.1 phosphate signaling complex protein PhoU [Isoptericola sp. b490]
MRDIFTAELTALGEDLVAMSRLVETAISSAGTALLTKDLALAEGVIADDHTIDAMERDLDERCVQLIAQQQPVARDLRIIIAGLRMSASLERMGDLARHVAELARLRYPAAALPAEVEPTFTAMHHAAVDVARKVTTVIENLDLDLAAEIESDDDTLDDLLAQTFTLTTSGSAAMTAQAVVDVTLLARYFERFGDHGVSVASRVVYLVTGEVEEHHAH